MMEDSSPTTNLIGFKKNTDRPHMEAIETANARKVRKTQLSRMVPRFIFTAEPIRDQARKAILDFKNNLPYQYEEDRENPEVREQLRTQALKYAELADPKNYRAYHTEENSNDIAIIHVSPSASKPEIVLRLDNQHLQHRHGVKRRTASFGAITIPKTLHEPPSKVFKVHRHIQHFQRISVLAQPLQMLRQGKQAFRVHSHTSIAPVNQILAILNRFLRLSRSQNSFL